MFLTKAIHIGFSSVFALAVGLVFNKLLALYYPYEYIGSFGLIKSYNQYPFEYYFNWCKLFLFLSS